MKEEKFSCRKRKGSDFRDTTSVAVLPLVGTEIAEQMRA